MGGFRSGWHRGGRVAVEDVLSVDVRRWQRDGLLEARDDAGAYTRRGWKWVNKMGERNASIMFDTRSDSVTFIYTITSGGEAVQVVNCVALDWTPLHFGGARPWFICPLCKRRAAILYILSPLGCRHCHKLTYRARNLSSMDRAIEQCHKLQERYGGEDGVLGGLGSRPKGMHRTTFRRIQRRYDRSAHVALAVGYSFIGRPMAPTQPPTPLKR